MATLRWLEKTESVIAINKCADENMVLYASNLFKGEALEWWNSVVQAKGRFKAYALEWEELFPHLSTPESNLINRYILGLVEEITDMVKSTMPRAIDSTIELGGIMTDGLIRKLEEHKAKEGTKKDEENGFTIK
ncbi:hypothetical protein L1987_06749 [Smallanthus sonchifolius]|uniref:Uncharacterized protein n=1 Tax=Smallanthus sonchifolius TaxID=185202 RepID=A0ACB9JYZ9_9ASTR|nr:hypothetical protein L1987_06749 [Smallanthus sonchifolius]